MDEVKVTGELDPFESCSPSSEVQDLSNTNGEGDSSTELLLAPQRSYCETATVEVPSLASSENSSQPLTFEVPSLALSENSLQHVTVEDTSRGPIAEQDQTLVENSSLSSSSIVNEANNVEETATIDAFDFGGLPDNLSIALKEYRGVEDNPAAETTSDIFAKEIEGHNSGRALEDARTEPLKDGSPIHTSKVDVGTVRIPPIATHVKNFLASTFLGTPRRNAGSPAIGSPMTDTPRSATSSKQVGEGRGLIDTAAPFDSVKDAVSKFGGIVDWKAHKIQTMERRKLVEDELEKVHEEIPEFKRRAQLAEEEKLRVVKDLDSTKRLIEELKLNLERAQTEEHQAKQDSELAKLRVEEMEQGIADDASVAAKAQLEVSKARHTAAVSELKSVKEELESLRLEYISLVEEKRSAAQKAEEAVAASKEVEKTVEELSIELIARKEALDSAQAAHLEAEEQRIGIVMAREQDCHNLEMELKQVEQELQKVKQQVQLAKDLKSKLDNASNLLVDLKAEMAAHVESTLNLKVDKTSEDPKKRPHNDLQAVVASARKELEEVMLNIEIATTEINCLKVAANSLRVDLEKEKLALETVRHRGGMATITVASLDADLQRTRAELAAVQAREKEAREKIAELPKQLQKAAQEADRARAMVQSACEELRRLKEEAEVARAGTNTLEGQLQAAQKEIEAARSSEKLAVAAIKALLDNESAQPATEAESLSFPGVILSLEEYYDLGRRAHEAEEQANARLAEAISQIDLAKGRELKSLEKLEEASTEMARRKKGLQEALEEAERANEMKLSVEQELRKWRAEHQEQQLGKNTNGSSQITTPSPRADPKLGSSQASNFLEMNESNNFIRIPELPIPGHNVLNQSSNHIHGSGVQTDASSPDIKYEKKKKRSFFPRILLFLARRKTHSSKST
ncbi:hypothetical protein SAY87_022276 [Trapa incisa]|uniref:Protein WEAK CHLOROPLAST MOVEMENT UNDER BLUE LIGHT 1-like n=1 Tax=Trapa incisa TaxID=236973 RepID=A0AAN7JSZ0_9MYRT|nr:hypothetical protein SAY87_022276 [Trapa incisa]